MTTPTTNILYNVTDFQPYELPVQTFFAKLRSTSEFTPIAVLADTPSSTIHKVHDKKENITVAMKTFKQPRQLDKASMERFEKETFREITILKSLNHDYVISLLHVVLDSDISKQCLIFEYCPTSLAKFIDIYPESRIKLAIVKCATKQMFLGLDYLHKNHITHRDLTTTNLLISSRGIIKIIDFGSSRRFNHEKDKPLTPNMTTRWYQAPEILLQAPTYGHQVDLWSAGCIVAELLVKKPLLRGESELHQINLIIDLIGSPNITDWPGLRQCRLPNTIDFKTKNCNTLSEHLNKVKCSDAHDFLVQLLVYDPSKRASASQCLEHEWLQRAPFAAKSMPIIDDLRIHQQQQFMMMGGNVTYPSLTR